MRKTFISCAILAVLSMTACTKSKTTTPGTGGTTGYAATMSAANYGFDGAAGTAFSSTAAGIVSAAGTFTISGVKDGGSKESISIVLWNVTATGTYDLDKDNAAGNGASITKDYSNVTDKTIMYSTDNTAAGTQNIGGGKVVVTSLTATDVEGTFYITANNSTGKAAFAEQGKFKGKINKQ